MTRSDAAHQRQRLLRRILAGILVTLVTLLITLATLAWTVWDRSNEQRFTEQYVSALNALEDGNQDDGIGRLKEALQIQPENQLASNRLFGLLTQRWLSLPLRGPFTIRSDEVRLEAEAGHIRVQQPNVFDVQDGGIYEFGSLPADSSSEDRPERDLLAEINPAPNENEVFDRLGGIHWSPDGRFILKVALNDKTDMTLYDLEKPGAPLAILRGLDGKVTGTAVFIPEKKAVVMALEHTGQHPSGQILVWNYGRGAEAKVISTISAVASNHGDVLKIQIIDLHRTPSTDRLIARLGDVWEPGNQLKKPNQLNVVTIDWESLVARLSPSISSVDAQPDVPWNAGINYLAVAAEDIFVPQVRTAPSLFDVKSNIIMESRFPYEWPTMEKAESRPQFLPGSDFFLQWGRNRGLLVHAEVGEDTRPVPNAFRSGPVWPTSNFWSMADNGFLLAGFMTYARQAVTEDAGQATVYDARTALLWPQVDIQPTAEPRQEPINEGSHAFDPNFDPSAEIRKNNVQTASNGTLLRMGIRTDATASRAHPEFELVRAGKQPIKLEGLPDMLDRNSWTAAFSDDGRLVVIAVANVWNMVQMAVWDTESSERLTNFTEPAISLFGSRKATLGRPGALKFMNETDVICIAGTNGGVMLWDWRRNRPYSELLGPIFHTREDYYSELSLKTEPGWIEVRGRTSAAWVTRRYEVGFPANFQLDSGPLLDLAMAMSGGVSVKSKTEAPSPAAEVRRLRKVFDQAKELEDPSVKLGRWLLSDRATRTVSPNATQTIPETFEKLLLLGAFDDAELLTFGDPYKIEKVKKARENE